MKETTNEITSGSYKVEPIPLGSSRHSPPVPYTSSQSYLIYPFLFYLSFTPSNFKETCASAFQRFGRAAVLTKKNRWRSNAAIIQTVECQDLMERSVWTKSFRQRASVRRIRAIDDILVSLPLLVFWCLKEMLLCEGFL